MVLATVRDLRRKNKLTQEQLAKKIGVAVSTIGNIEIGKHKPSKPTIEKLALVFSVKPNSIR